MRQTASTTTFKASLTKNNREFVIISGQLNLMHRPDSPLKDQTVQQ